MGIIHCIIKWIFFFTGVLYIGFKYSLYIGCVIEINAEHCEFSQPKSIGKD